VPDCFRVAFIEGFERTAGTQAAEQLLDQLPVIPLFEPAAHDGEVPIPHALPQPVGAG